MAGQEQMWPADKARMAGQKQMWPADKVADNFRFSRPSCLASSAAASIA